MTIHYVSSPYSTVELIARVDAKVLWVLSYPFQGTASVTTVKFTGIIQRNLNRDSSESISRGLLFLTGCSFARRTHDCILCLLRQIM